MNTAFLIAMAAVAISLGVVFLGVRANKRKQADNRHSSDGGTNAATDSSSADCGPGDGGGCDGGGGGSGGD